MENKDNRPKNNRIKLYCEPKIKHFIAETWLQMGFWDGIFYVPIILSQLGMAGNTTAYGDTEVLKDFSFKDSNKSTKKTRFLVHFVNSPEQHFSLLFFREGDKQTSSCIIPGYELGYTNNFAVQEKTANSVKLLFYEYYDIDYTMVPRFMKEYLKNGIFCIETTEAETIRVTFKVERENNAILLTVKVKNDNNSKNVLDFYKDQILKILNTEKAKSVYIMYEKVNKFLGHITNDYVISYQSPDESITDEIVISDGKTEKFMITSFSNRYTLFKTQKWEMNTDDITIQCEDGRISFPDSNFTIKDVEKLATAVEQIQKFITENMEFAFESPNP